MPEINTFLARFANAPILVAPDQAAKMSMLLSNLAADPHLRELTSAKGDGDVAPVMLDNFWFAADDWRSAYRPYHVVNGVLQIPIKGFLLHDFPWASTWATGYQYVWKAFERGLSDAEVKGIALVVDSPGGEVAGCFDLVDKMWARINEKPVEGFAAEGAYSAAYAAISVARKITVDRTGGVGSIGVYTSHVDVSKAYDEMGVKVTLIHAGKHKVDGNPFEALPKDVQARMQARVDHLYGIFTASVARNRAMSEKSVRNTEALTYSAPDAIAVGLADAVGSLEDSLAAFTNALQGGNVGDENMTTKTPEAAALTQADVDAAKAAGVAEGTAAGTTAGRTAERARITAILALDSAKTRGAAAANVATTTDMTVEQADALLKTLPESAKAGTGASPTPFAAVMDKIEQPAVGSVADTPANADKAKAAEILSAQRGGETVPKKK